MKIDNRLVAKCGNLIVPENRQKQKGNQVKIPFVFVRKPNQDSTQNIILNTTGGPGYATITIGDSVRFNSERLAFGGFLFFDQRGTKNAKPCLDCEGIDEAIKISYRKNQSKDSLVGLAATKCRKKFEQMGIDLSAYNTIESAADINDLRKVLGIQSLTLFGLSYSGGLMLTVAQNHPEGVKSLMLLSPLPSFVNYEEHALFNHNEAINKIFEGIEADSIQNKLYPNLRKGFRDYFTAISDKKFTINYWEKGSADSIKIVYSKNELLDAIFDRMNNNGITLVPAIIHDLIIGKHENHIKNVLDSKFSNNDGLSYGMRLSVYCTEQIAYSNIQLVKKQDEVLPWLAGYPFNNVNHYLCECWKVKPLPKSIKSANYLKIPAIISGGEFDPWTPPFYNTLIKRTMPNAQILMIKNRAHIAGFGPAGTTFLTDFMTNPYQKLVSKNENVVVE
ncbi:MAG: alpha/beta fold hydrolase [Bacteroidota bacterium]